MEQGRVTLWLDKDDLAQLMKIAEKHGDTSASRIIRELVRDYIAKNKRFLKGSK